MKRNSLVLLFLFFASAGHAVSPLRYLPQLPFAIGERLVYSVRSMNMNVGDQIVTIEKQQTFQGMNVVVAKVVMTSSGLARAVYRLDDTEKTYFLPDGIVPVFYCKWVNEGSWHDYLEAYYFPGEPYVEVFSRNAGVRNRIAAPADVENVFTLIFSLRCLDYDYYIGGDKRIEVDYVMGDRLIHAVFKASYTTLKIGGVTKNVIYLEETGGLKAKFYFENAANRLPLKMIIPSYNASGRTIEMIAELKDFTLGATPITY